MPKAIESPVQPITVPSGDPLEVTVVGPVTTELPGPVLLLESGSVTSTPGTPQTLITDTVPMGKEWRVRKVEVVSRAYATFSAKIAGDEFESGKTNPATPTVALLLPSYFLATAGQAVTLEYDQAHSPAVPVEARVHYTEHDV